MNHNTFARLTRIFVPGKAGKARRTRDYLKGPGEEAQRRPAEKTWRSENRIN